MTLAASGTHDSTGRHPTDPAARLQRLHRDDLTGTATGTARFLLGMLIVRDDGEGRRLARIVETEAYAGPGDRASHARAGRTPRTSVMFGPPGHAYVYLVYGMHHCLNVVCGRDGDAAAVLIRAVEPLGGLARMRERRGSVATSDARLGAGPARACRVLDIDREMSGLDLITDTRLWLADDGTRPDPDDVVSGPRIGVGYAGQEWASRPWRFGIADSPALSKPFPAGP